jgi:hypothetical protein
MMNPGDIAALMDLSAYSGLNEGILRTWLTSDVIAHWNIT